MTSFLPNPALSLFLSLPLLLLSPPIQGALTNNSNVAIAIADMKEASYNGFVMLLEMMLQGGSQQVPFPLHEITLLMPSDRLLADDNTLSSANLGEFLARHSIPLNLKFNNLLHFPTTTLIPSSFPPYRLQVSNHGRSAYFLNNAQILHPNVCRGSISISCHGISEVLNASFSYSNSPPPRVYASPPPSPAVVPSPSESNLPPHASDDIAPRSHSVPAPSPAKSTSEGVASGGTAYTTAFVFLLSTILALGI